MNDELNLSLLFRVLLDGRWWIMAITLLFALCGVAYALLATPVYQADALVQVEDNQEAMSDFFNRDERYQSQNPAKGMAEMQIVRSRLVVGSVVEDLKLDIVVSPVFGLLDIFEGLFEGEETPAGSVSPVAQQAVPGGWRDPQREIQIEHFAVPAELRDKKFALLVTGGERFELRFDDTVVLRGSTNQDLTSADGQVALRVSSLRAPEGSLFHLTRLHKLTAVEQLVSQLTVTEQGKGTGILKLTLTNSSAPLAAQILNAVTESYLSQNVQRQALEAEKSLAFLAEKLPEIREALNAAEQELSGYRTQAESVDLSEEARTLLEQQVNLATSINELKSKETELRPLFTREHPHYRSLMEQKTNLESERRRLDKMVQQLPATEQKVLRLTRDVEVYKELYVQLVNRSEELKVVKAGSVGNVRILDHAEVQPAPVAPRKAFIAVLATMLGGMVGVGSVLVHNGFHGRLERPSQIEQIGIPVYAVLPTSAKRAKLGKDTKHPSKRTARRNGRRPSGDLLAIGQPSDATVEALRSLRTSLTFALRSVDNNVLMIAGSRTGVGKSFVTANLAVLFAQAGQRVLLIDGDMRHGHLHFLFDAQEGKGLSHYLAGKSDQTEIVHNTRIEGVDLIPRGDIPSNPAELLMQPRLSMLLTDAAGRYDVTLIDTPPALAVTDAMIIGRLSGINLLVVRADVSTLDEVALTYRRFEQNGIALAGSVFNGLKPGLDSVYDIGHPYYG